MACRISDELFVEGMRIVCMENELIEVCILVDRGADIYSFKCKLKNENLLLNLPGRMRNPSRDFSQMRDTKNQFEDYYYGGWQEILPNSEPMQYRGASLGQHGEISLIPWKYEIVSDHENEVSLKVQVSPLRFPVKLEKILTLRSGEGTLQIEETLVNLSSTTLDLMWGHHIAFGRSFLAEGAKIKTNAKDIISELVMPDNRIFQPDIKTSWPNVLDLDGNTVRADQVPPHGQHHQSELSYLSGYTPDAYYEISSNALDISFRLSWQGTLFSHLWYWQEYYGVQDFPWWGDCYTVALEPWTAPYSDKPHEKIDAGEWLKLKPHEVISTRLTAEIIQLAKR